MSDQYANEEVPSNYTYPNGYKIKGIAEQVARLHQLFPELKDTTFDEKIAQQPLPVNAEGWFAILRWEMLVSSYGEAVEKMLTTIRSTRMFNIWRHRIGQNDPGYPRQHAKTMKAFQKLGDEQKGHNILIVPCQFGLHHRGRSVRRAHEVMNAVEFGLGVFAVGCMILTHPERELQWGQVHIDCAGDEYSEDANGCFFRSPIFYFAETALGFDKMRFDPIDPRFGSVSGFLLPEVSTQTSAGQDQPIETIVDPIKPAKRKPGRI